MAITVFVLIDVYLVTVNTDSSINNVMVINNRQVKYINLLKYFSLKSFLWTRFFLIFILRPRKFYIRRNNNKVDSIETGRIVIAHLLP